MPPDPVQVLSGRKGGHISWANTLDRTARTAPARDALERKFLDQADGDPMRPRYLSSCAGDAPHHVDYPHCTTAGATRLIRHAAVSRFMFGLSAGTRSSLLAPTRRCIPRSAHLT